MAITSLQTMFADHDAEVSSLQARHDTLAGQVDGLVASNSAKQSTIDGMTAELADLRIQLQKAKDALNAQEAAGMRFGAAVGGNADPVPFETSLGRKLQVHRTYFGNNTAGVVAQCKADIAAGRIPIVSIKYGAADAAGSWTAAWKANAAGTYDASFKDLYIKLEALKGEIWVVIYHEPEGDGDIAQWKAMQTHFAGITRPANVKLGVALTGYPQFGGSNAAYKLPAIFPAGQFDFVGFDTYQRYGTTDAGLNWTPLDNHFAQAEAFSKSKGIPWVLTETGVTNEAFAANPGAIDDLVDIAEAHGCSALSYFNSELNSKGTWILSGAKLAALKARLAK